MFHMQLYLINYYSSGGKNMKFLDLNVKSLQ